MRGLQFLAVALTACARLVTSTARVRAHGGPKRAGPAGRALRGRGWRVTARHGGRIACHGATAWAGDPRASAVGSVAGSVVSAVGSVVAKCTRPGVRRWRRLGPEDPSQRDRELLTGRSWPRRAFGWLARR